MSNSAMQLFLPFVTGNEQSLTLARDDLAIRLASYWMVVGCAVRRCTNLRLCFLAAIALFQVDNFWGVAAVLELSKITQP